MRDNRDKRPLRRPPSLPYAVLMTPRSNPTADRTPPAEWLHCGLISPQSGLETPRFGPELASFAPGAQE